MLAPMKTRNPWAVAAPPCAVVALCLALNACVSSEALLSKSTDYRAMPIGHCIALFDGRSLAGWQADVPKADNNPSIAPSFVVRDGLLVSLGEPRGHLVTTGSYSDYRLVVEYRFAGKPGNCGVLVHCSTPRVLYEMFPASIEVQMEHGNAGDFWCIGENIKVPEMEVRRPRKEGQKWGGMKGHARHIHNLTDDSEKPAGEWNRMEIICKGDEVVVWVNGDLVNHGYGATVKSGRIALQAEGSEVEFRRIDLYPLAPPSAQPTAP